MKRLSSVLLLSLVVAPVDVLADFRFAYNGHTYDVITTPLPWAAASADAQTRTYMQTTGHLVKIETAGENSKIAQEIADNIHEQNLSNSIPTDGGGPAAVWTGANDNQGEGAWRWSTDDSQFWQGDGNGQAVDNLYSNWGNLGEKEPNNYGGQDYGTLVLDAWPFGTEGQWDDVSGDNTLFYIVEYNATESPATDRVTVSSELDIDIPSADYQSLDLWVKLNYLGVDDTGRHIWTLQDFGVN